MPLINEKEISRLSSYFQLIVTIVGAIGAFAGIFYLMGNLIIISYLNKMNLYGIVSFKPDFFKEALMSLTISVFQDKIILFLSIIFLLPWIIVLVRSSGRVVSYIKKNRRFFALINVIYFIFLLPIYYGYLKFDINVFGVEQVYLNDSMLNVLNSNAAGKSLSAFYVSGHTNDKDVFFDASEGLPPKLVIINKNEIKGIKCSSVSVGFYKLRELQYPALQKSSAIELLSKKSKPVELDSSERELW